MLFSVGPSNTYIHGDEMVMPDGDVEYSCTSDESNPASEITVQITDQDGNDIAIEVTKQPKMKGNAGFASALFASSLTPLPAMPFVRLVLRSYLRLLHCPSTRLRSEHPPMRSLICRCRLGAQGHRCGNDG